MSHERIKSLAILGVTAFAIKEVSLWAFNKSERDVIKQRDHFQCQFPEPHKCEGQLEVHHILPQRYCKTFDIDPDFPENAITLCHYAHIDLIHPDMADAIREQRNGNKNAVAECLAKRDLMLQDRIVYWNTEYDRALYARSLKNTQQARNNGWVWPEKNHRKQRT